jgi:hypothetical protein
MEQTTTTRTNETVGTAKAESIYKNRGIQLFWLFIVLVDSFLMLDFFFRLAAGRAVGFADFIYQVGGVLAAPFDGIFGVAVKNGIYMFKWSDLLAVVVYAGIAYFITEMIEIGSGDKDKPTGIRTTTTTGTTHPV